MSDRNVTARFATLVAVFCATAACGIAQISVVNMKDGKKYEGFVLSDDAKAVKVETMDGKVLTLLKNNVESLEETKRWGDPEIDAEYEKIDASDASALAEVAHLAKSRKVRSWQYLAEKALKLDAAHDRAHELLGHEKVGDKWFTNKADAEKARKAAFEAEMKEKGFVKVGSGAQAGWIPKADKASYDKDSKAWTKDERGVFRRTAELMKERGLELVGGKWIRAASEEDRKDAAEFQGEFEEKIVVLTSRHFRIFCMEHEPDRVASFLDEAENTYKWFVEKMGKEPGTEVFPEGGRGQLWFLKDKRLFDKFVNKYGAPRFGMSADWVAHITQPGSNGGTISGLGLHAITTVENLDENGVRASVVHNSSHMLVQWFVRNAGGVCPVWLFEGWAHYAEHERVGIGQQTCVTKANYGAGGGISDKKFTTKDAKDRCKTMIRDGDDEVFESISKKGLNSLNGDDLAKGYSIIDWLMKERKADFINFLESIEAADDEKVQQANALKKAFNWSFADVDAEWRKMAKKNY
ncbi:MAG TPA: hypothetical protein VEI02_10105 [Planctomycetota bacterium]|nr:hypothetical protein [Planctomycetota bacterium]